MTEELVYVSVTQLSCVGYCVCIGVVHACVFFFFQAEDGIRDLVRSRGLGDVYKRQYSGCGISLVHL